MEENAKLKARAESLTSALTEANALIQELRSTATRSAGGASNDPVLEEMDVDLVRGLSSLDSKWASVPCNHVPSKQNLVAESPKKTLAQIAAAQGSSTLRLPKKRMPAPQTSAKVKTAAARPFMEPNTGPKGFKYMFIPRAQKLTRSEVRSRLRKVGIETSRVIDLIFLHQES